MRKEVKRKLDAVVRRERRRYIFFGMLGILTLIAAVYWFRPPVARVVHDNAKLTWSARRIDSETGRSYLQMTARLRDGRLVNVQSRVSTFPPAAGSEVRIVEERHWQGQSKFVWEGTR